MKIAILTSKNQLLESYALKLSKELNSAKIYKNHHDKKQSYFVL
jgi:hypothetical protein